MLAMIPNGFTRSVQLAGNRPCPARPAAATAIRISDAHDFRSIRELLGAPITHHVQSASTMNPEELQNRVAALRWYHSIDLGHGIVTPGIDNSPERLAR